MERRSGFSHQSSTITPGTPTTPNTALTHGSIKFNEETDVVPRLKNKASSAFEIEL